MNLSCLLKYFHYYADIFLTELYVKEKYFAQIFPFTFHCFGNVEMVYY